MSAYTGAILAGLGGGAVIAALALGLVLTYRSSRAVNFAHAAMGMYVAFAYFEFRDRGDVVLPILGLPSRFRLVPTPTLVTALAFALVLSALLGATVYWLVFRPLRAAPPLARIVASLGLLVYFQELVRLRFPTAGASAVNRLPVLPEDNVRILGTGVSQNRLLLGAGVVLVTGALVVVFRSTRFGLATRAAAGNEKGAVLIGISPDAVGTANWVLASVLGGFAVILIEPIAGLDALTTSLLVLPALAAALFGGLSSFALTTAAGLGIGIVQSVILGHSVRPEGDWIPDWLTVTGLQQTVPVVVVLAVLVWRGDPLPTRAAAQVQRLPPAPVPRHVARWLGLLVVAVVTGLLNFGPEYRQALIVTMIATLLALSFVVLTGYAGQVSLAQLSVAGVAGFVVIEIAERGAPFLVAAPLAVALAGGLGALIGLPARRVRGMSLAVATLAAALVVEELVLGSPSVSGGAAGRQAPRPDVFGIDVGVSAPGTENFRPEFGFVVLAFLVAAFAAAAAIRRNDLGLRWLAVRANERAAAAAGIDVGRAKTSAFVVSSVMAGAVGVLLAYANSTLSRTSFMVIGTLVALALTYLAGISSLAGAVVAGLIARNGLVTTLLDRGGDGSANRYVFAISGIALVVTAIAAPEGITGLVRRRLVRLRRDDVAPVAAAPAVESAT